MREGRLGRSRFEELGTHMVFMNVEHWKGRRWDEDWCAWTEDHFDGAEAVDWKEMYDILRVVSRVPRKGRRNWKILGRRSCGNWPTGITKASTPSTKLRGRCWRKERR